MYRPENWDELKRLGDKALNDENYLDNVFEAGADAMLEGLLDKGLKVNNLGDIPQGKGTIIFIPDEQVKKDE